jgi:LPPG:FO 2-phospho-L-lactate transferase
MQVAVTVCVLAGGVGAARLLAGMVRVVPPADITAVVNVADDDRIHGLAVSPDIDTVLYTVSGRIDPDRGWGLAGETWRAMEALRAIATTVGRDDLGWFNLGDADLGTHLYRTTRLGEGATLTEVTAELTRAFGVGCRVLPVSDDPLGTRLTTTGGDRLAFQEYFVRERHSVAVAEVTVAGAETARPAPGVLEAIGTAERVVIAPSNPIVSIGPLLAVPGVRDAVAARRDDTVAVSPIVGGAALKGPADRLMAELGHEVSVVGVARLYRDLAAILVVDDVDAGLAPAVEAEGIRCVVAPTIMSDPDRAAALARVVLGS